MSDANTTRRLSRRVNIYDVFKSKLPSTAVWTILFGLIIISVILLALTLIPSIAMYETDFSFNGSQSDLNIGNFGGVTQILWGTWRACYSSSPTNTLCSGTDLPKNLLNPYSFVIESAGTGNSASVKQLWLHVMFLQVIGLIFAAFIGLLLILRRSALICCGQKVKLDSEGNPKKERTCTQNITNILTGILFLWITIIVILNIVVVLNIKAEMLTLDLGENVSVVTKPAVGFWLPVIADVVTFLVCIVVLFVIRRRVKKDIEMEDIRYPVGSR